MLYHTIVVGIDKQFILVLVLHIVKNILKLGVMKVDNFVERTETAVSVQVKNPRIRATRITEESLSGKW